MSTVEKDCVVHDRKYLSKFHGTINQLRRKNEFNISILQKLPKRCCSCNGLKGESSLTLDNLRKICHEIESSATTPFPTPKPIQTLHNMVLQYPSTCTRRQRVIKSGRFVGKNGSNLRQLEDKYKMKIYIVNSKSSKPFQKTLVQIKQNNENKYLNDLWLLFTMNNNDNDKNSVENIKKSLENEWNKIDISTVKSRLNIRSVSSASTVTTTISGDSRWTQKTSKSRKKHRTHNKSIEEPEVPPQPLVKPISMPQEVTKHKQHK